MSMYIKPVDTSSDVIIPNISFSNEAYWITKLYFRVYTVAVEDNITYIEIEPMLQRVYNDS